MSFVKKYVPILKWKRGERIAFRNLSPSIKNNMIPLFNIMKNETIEAFIKNTSRDWGIKIPFYVDFHSDFIKKRKLEVNSFMQALLENAINSNLYIIPVITTARDIDFMHIINSKFDALTNGYAIRINTKDFDNFDNNIKEIIYEINNINNKKIDLIIDLASVELPKEVLCTLSNIVDSIIEKSKRFNFSNIILGGSSFPQYLIGLKKYQISSIVRKEWIIWNEVHKKNPFVIYADYGPDDPFELDLSDGATIIPTIRYTFDDYWYIFRGEYNPARPRDYSQFHKLSQQLINNAIYCGKGYSWGDKKIYDCAKKECIGINCNHGNLESWVQIATNHHVTYIVNYFSSSF